MPTAGSSLGILEGSNATFQNITGAELAIHMRVKLLADGTIALAGILDPAIAVTKEPIPNLQHGVCRLLNATGTQFGTASEAIVVGDRVYGAAIGKVSKTAAGAQDLKAVALSAASGADVVFTYCPTQF